MGASAWLLLPWLLVSHIPLRLGTLVAERTMYLPSVGMALLLPRHLAPPRGARGAATVAGATAYFASRCLRRTLDWRTDETAFETALEVCPRSAKLQQQMCTLRTNQGRLAEALAHCDASFEIDSSFCGRGPVCGGAAAGAFCDVHSSYGLLHVRRNDVGAALWHLNEITRDYPRLPENTRPTGAAIWHLNASLGCVYTSYKAKEG